ncbi:hypothetical protein [Microseira wollei]|uniref:hypothetical protein n=1 Tax=Microseira wollei TaxID=467598 RepID=UPI001CFE4BC2|nr:hypothetical protein [Microseira wollei]
MPCPYKTAMKKKPGFSQKPGFFLKPLQNCDEKETRFFSKTGFLLKAPTKLR